MEKVNLDALPGHGIEKTVAFGQMLRARSDWPVAILELRGEFVLRGLPRPYPRVQYCISVNEQRREILLKEYGRRIVDYAPAP